MENIDVDTSNYHTSVQPQFIKGSANSNSILCTIGTNYKSKNNPQQFTKKKKKKMIQVELSTKRQTPI